MRPTTITMSYTVGNLHNIQASRIFFKGDVVHWLLMYRDTHAELTRHNPSSNLRITNTAKIVIQAAGYAQG